MGWPCPDCGKELTTQRGVRQHHTKVHGEPLPNRTCKGCGTEFYDPKARRKYCDDCNPNADEHNGNWKGGKETTTCESCGGAFQYYPSSKKGIYCPVCVAGSDEFLGDPSWTVHEPERVHRTCEHCGREMVVLRSELDRGRGRFCSHACLCLWMSEEGTRSYNRGWSKLRQLALARDDHTCQSCGKTGEDIGRELDVHHLKPVRLFDEPSDAHGLDNVVCLCRSCHTRIEWQDGRTL